MLYRGSCHCGAVAFEAEGELASVAQCNSSICSKRGALHWFVPGENFRLLTPEGDQATYTFGKHEIRHRFCPVCGVPTYSEGVSPTGKAGVMVNARCLEDVDLSTLAIRKFDGKSL